MGFWSFLNHWWNLPFLVMLGLCAMFVLLQAIGLIGGGEGHGEHDSDAEHELDAHAHADVSGGGSIALWHEVLGFVGVGRVPFMVVWVSLFLCCGFAGIFANRVLFLALGGGYSGWWFMPVALFALGTGLFGARFAATVAARFVDVSGHGATAKRELIGSIAVVASARCDERFGEVRARDAGGNELLLHAVLAAERAPLPRGSTVVLVDFDAERDLFTVAAAPELDVRQV
jgi:hypothetical protein